MFERPAKVLMISAVAIVAMVTGCAVWLLRVPAVPRSANQYISENFVFEESRPSVGGAKTASEAPQAPAPAPALDQSRLPLEAAPDPSTQTAVFAEGSQASSALPAESTLPAVAGSAAGALPQRSRHAISILQLGDSHTAADFFSGELRRRLQARFGLGGAGYLAAGKPHLGIRTGLFKVTTSAGWTYPALQRSEDVSQFWLSGFNAVSTTPGNTITYTSDTPMSFDSIEFEAIRQPHGGSIEVRLDGVLASTFDFNGAAVEPIVFRLRPKQRPVEKFRQLEITTTGDGPVVLSSVAIYNSRSGISLSAVGYPGATVSVLNKFAPDLFADDLRRINPQIVILSFGTNEASNDKLTATSYASTYEGVIDKIRTILPSASVVIIGPPDGDERATGCKNVTTEATCRAPQPDRPPQNTAQPGNPSGPDCNWHQLPKLGEVRDAQREIATRGSFAYWNWASIQPQECGAHRWVTATPALMTPDHIHFTHDGYAKSANQFLPTLLPLIEKYGVNGKAASTE